MPQIFAQTPNDVHVLASDAIASAGIFPVDDLAGQCIAQPAQIIRVDSVDGKRGNKHCWAVLMGNCFVFADWRYSKRHQVWLDSGQKKLTSPQGTHLDAILNANEKERGEKQNEAARQAILSLREAEPANSGHPYLQKKRIPPERLYQRGNKLLVPLTDINGIIWSLQSISEDGKKRFQTGAKIAGCFWMVGEDRESVFLGEGMATMAAVRRATGSTVIAAMTANNLTLVAEQFHKRCAGLPMIICADDDEAGHIAAIKASNLTGAKVVYPKEKP